MALRRPIGLDETCEGWSVLLVGGMLVLEQEQLDEGFC